MKLRFTSMVIATLLSPTAISAEYGTKEYCKQKESRSERQICLSMLPVEKKSTAARKWHVTRDKLLDGTTNISVFKFASTGKAEGATAPMLRASCNENKTSSMVVWGAMLHRNTKVLYKLDDEEVISGNFKASGPMVRPKNSIAFLKSLSGHKNLTFQAGGSHNTVVFEIDDIQPVIDEIRQVCNW